MEPKNEAGIPSPFPPPLNQPPVEAAPEPEQQDVNQMQAGPDPEIDTDPDPDPDAGFDPADQQAAGGQPAQQPQQPPPYAVIQAYYYFTKGMFDRDVAGFQAAGNLRTGYKTLDRIQPFYPGFYCLGAISSLGKTTFSVQLADQLAAAGQCVLYFSLEQTAFELYSKSLARCFFRTNRADTRKNNRPSTYPTPTSMDIRRGLTTAFPAEMAQQINDYIQAVNNRLCVIHGAFFVTVEDIVSMVTAFVQQNLKPVVIVDYLQIIAPSLINGRIPDTKTSIDHIVHTLKAMQSSMGITVLAISSLNRMNYLTPVDFESFKESGGIEYTADVIWGLQLSVLNDDTFYYRYDNSGNRKGETSLKEKREKIQQEKASTPRHIDLVCLKNRYGVSSYTVPFEYYPASDYFCPPFDPNDPATWD